MSVVVAAAAITQLIIAFICDVRTQTIPNWLTLSSFFSGVGYHAVVGGWDGLLESIGGASAGFFPLLALYALRGIGAGDVKLFGAIGAWIGALLVAQLMLYSILYAGAIGIILIVLNRSFSNRLTAALFSIVVPATRWTSGQWFSWAKSGKSFPFMLAVAPAAATVWIMPY